MSEFLKNIIENKEKEKETINLTFLENPDGRKAVMEQIENILFADEICKNITNELEDEMLEYFDDESIDKIIEYINKKSLRERKKILAYPLEVRDRLFSVWSEKISAGEKTEEDFVDFLLEQSNKEDYNIGYHVSNADIKKEFNGGNVKWVVRGYEPDHRDNDIPMAYYSQDYMHRYRKDGEPKFLYIIRSVENNEKLGGHRRDGDNRWGRAPGLDIIHKVDMSEIKKKVNKKLDNKFYDLDKDTLERYIKLVYNGININNPSVEEKDLLDLVK